MDRPVQLEHGARPRGLMEPVDVLRHQRAQLAGTLELDERPVTSARRRGPSRVVHPFLPGLAPDLRVGTVGRVMSTSFIAPGFVVHTPFGPR